MELFFLAVLFGLMIAALASGFPVAFALPGASIAAIGLAGISGWLFTGDSGAWFTQDGPIQWLSAGVTNFRGIYWEVERDTLIAIPLFIFMGIMLQRSRIAEDLLVAMARLFGPIPGGLGISVVFVGALLAATTGIVGATVVAMGLISLPAMLKHNYSKPLATGAIAASGTLGQIIPPSIVLIILADQLSNAADQAGTLRKTLYKQATGEFSMPSAFDVTSASAGDMFLGAFIPGIVLVSLYMVYILVTALINPKKAPAVPREGALDRQFFISTLLALVPPLLLIFIVLGSIIAGIATVNQAGAIGSAGAMVMAGYRLHRGRAHAFTPAIIAILAVITILFLHHQFDLNVRSIDSTSDQQSIWLAAIAVLILMFALSWSGWRVFKTKNTLYEVMVETARTTSMVFIILLGAAMLTAAFRGFGGEEIVRTFLTGLPGGFTTQFIVVMAVIFVLGFFLDFIEIAVVVVPIVAPILLADPEANVTAVWLGVMIGVNMQTSFLTPPFGFALFYLRGVASKLVKTIQIYRGVIPFIALQLLGLVIVGLYPPLVNYLPTRTALTSETAPPARNPKLQACLRDYVFPRLHASRAEITAQADLLRMQAKGVLSNSAFKDLDGALNQVAASFGLANTIEARNADYATVGETYRPFQQAERTRQGRVLKIEREVGRLRQEQSFLSREPEANAQALDRLAAAIDDRTAELEALEAATDPEWAERSAAFTKIAGERQAAINAWQRSNDQAWEALDDLSAQLADAQALSGLRGSLQALRGVIEHHAHSDDYTSVMAEIKAVEDELGKRAGAGSMKSALSRARRALRGRNASPEKALQRYGEAIQLFESELAWRLGAARGGFADQLGAFNGLISETIGARAHPKLGREPALALSRCLARHRDISLEF
ncbi:MAG: TRAP transporter large permease subunit [Pseudomonadota bacterium]